MAAFFETRDDYKCFDVDDPGGLVVILQDLMSYEDELRICSANLLYAIYKVEVIQHDICNNSVYNIYQHDFLPLHVERT